MVGTGRFNNDITSGLRLEDIPPSLLRVAVMLRLARRNDEVAILGLDRDREEDMSIANVYVCMCVCVSVIYNINHIY